MTSLLSPTIALGVVLSTAYAALFNLWQRGNLRALRNYLVAAWIGFGAGHLIGEIADIQWLVIGQLNVAVGTLGAAVALLIAKSLEA